MQTEPVLLWKQRRRLDWREMIRLFSRQKRPLLLCAGDFHTSMPITDSPIYAHSWGPTKSSSRIFLENLRPWHSALNPQWPPFNISTLKLHPHPVPRSKISPIPGVHQPGLPGSLLIHSLGWVPG